ncbi:hypothetical protein PTKIN_Ptkin08bG0177000 [Pterospermum kingtungense]
MALEDQFETLELLGNEEEEIDLDEGGVVQRIGRVDLCLVGRFLTERSINLNAMSFRLLEIWRPGKGEHIKDIFDSRYLFQFFHEVDLNLSVGVWSMDVQIYEVPVGYFLDGVGKLLENFIGEFLEYDPKNSASFWRTYIRIPVKMDIRFPLKPFKKIKVAGGMVWVTFQYERLPTFCFIC